MTCEGILQVSKSVGFTPTGELKDANCWERRGAKKSYNGCCAASSVKEMPDTAILCFKLCL